LKLNITKFLILGLATCLASFSVAAQTLKIATIAPEGSTWMVEMKAGAEEITNRTEGRVKFRFYGGGVMGTDNQVRRKMRIGQLHGSTFTSGSLAGFAIEADLYSLPLTFRSMDEVLYVRSKMDHYVRDALENAGLVNFGLSGAGQGFLMSNVPVATPQDMRGQKTWVQEGDRIAYAAFEALGISPVAMPLTDVLTGLQTELLDSAAVSPVGAIIFQLHTALRYVTDLPLSYVYGALAIDAKAFGKLTENDQAVVREVMETIYKNFDETSIKDNINSLKALQDSGLELISPDVAAVPEWRSKVAESNQRLADEGIINQELLNELLQHLEDFRSGNTQ
jgi:TRAP-type C4-dicarboxylate transport system substrate-binding protein